MKKGPRTDVKSGALSSRKLFGELDTNREGRGESKTELKDPTHRVPPPASSLKASVKPERKVRFEDAPKVDPVRQFINAGWRDDDEEIEMPAGMTGAEQEVHDEAYYKKKLEELEAMAEGKINDIDMEAAFDMPWFTDYEKIVNMPWPKIPMPPMPPEDSPLNPFRDLPPVDGPPICEDFVFDVDEEDLEAEIHAAETLEDLTAQVEAAAISSSTTTTE